MRQWRIFLWGIHHDRRFRNGGKATICSPVRAMVWLWQGISNQETALLLLPGPRNVDGYLTNARRLSHAMTS